MGPGERAVDFYFKFTCMLGLRWWAHVPLINITLFCCCCLVGLSCKVGRKRGVGAVANSLQYLERTLQYLSAMPQPPALMSLHLPGTCILLG